jgi:plastocyanin
MRFIPTSRLLLTAVIAVVTACGDAAPAVAPPSPPPSAPPKAPPADDEVTASASLAFTPPTVTIKRGGTVTFDFEGVGHNVFFDNAPPGAPANIAGVNANVSKTLTFPATGTFAYNCHIHPGMRGTVVVVEP